jgi:hypothetical protein
MRATTLALLLLSPVALAQTPDHLVGLTRLIPALHHHDHWNCQPLTRCSPAGFPPALASRAAGGTAWNSARSGAWICNGAVIALVDDTCNYLCPTMPIPLTTANAVITGLDNAEGMNLLWMTDSLNNVYQFRPSCPLQLVSMCTLTLPITINGALTGVVVDEQYGIVIYTYSDFGTGLTQLLVARAGAPCQILQTVPLPRCANTPNFGPVTGSAVDWYRGILYVTDGNNTEAIRYTVAATGVVFGATNCCFLPIITLDNMVGLAVRPGRETPRGNPCNNGACPNCPMVHTLVNDPNMGNLQFALDLRGAPSPSLAWCIIGVGACSPAPVIPPLCGPVLTPNILGTLGPIHTGTGGGCGGSAVFPLPLPLIPSLCGTVVSSQCSVLCPGASHTVPFGTALSNCLSFLLQGT